MRTHLARATLLAWALAALPLPARAETLLDRTGEITSTDPTRSDNSHYDEYAVPVRAGDRIVIEYESGDFDAFLYVTPPGGSEVHDDDGAGGTNSRMELAIERDGTLRIQANTVRAGEVGAYRLRVTRGAGASAQETSAPADRDTLLDRQGRIETTDPRRADDSHYDRYVVNVRAGERISVLLESADFDAYLFATPPGGEERGSNDGGGGRDARLDLVIERDGALQVVANTLSAGEIGAYRIRVARNGSGLPAPASAAAGAAPAVDLGGDILLDVEGVITASDPVRSDNSHFQRHTVPVRAGDRITVRQESTDFDAYLFATPPGGVEQGNDDGGGGTDAQLELEIIRDGELVVDANTLRAATTGRYRLRAARSGTFGARATAANEGEVLLDQPGRLDATDPLRSDNSHYDRYVVPVAAGDRLVVDVVSSDFDAYLFVTLPDGSVLSNDDGGGGTHSRLEITAPSAGDLLVDANSLRAQTTGSYRVRVARAAGSTWSAPQNASSFNVAAGDWVYGRLEPGDEVRSDESYQDAYRIPGRAGERFVVTMESTDFDAILLASGPGGLSEYNDDGAGNRNPRLDFTLSAAGTVTIYANSYGAGAKIGGYRIRVERSQGSGAAAGSAPVVAQTLRIGETREGRLASGDAQISDQSYIDEYEFRGTQGLRVVVRLESTDGGFDPLLSITGPQFSETNDDGGEGMGTNSRIEATLPADGTYRIRVNSYGAGAKEGGYRLILAQAGGPTPAVLAGAAVRVGETRDGALGPGDETVRSGELVDWYHVDLRAGDRVAIDLSSAVFDPYLVVRGPNGFSENNDDYGGQTSSRIELIAPEAGTYRVGASSYRPGMAGAYRLSLSPLGATAARDVVVAANRTQPLATGSTQGALSTASTTLEGGRLATAYRFTGARGQSWRFGLASSAIDPLLILRGPGNFVRENDDAEGRNSLLEVTLPADGEYTLLATSYRPGEVGAYTLSANRGAATPPPAPGAPPRPGAPATLASARVWGIFAGITDYPDGVSDLPECAQDAVKLAQGLRQAGVMTEAQQIVLTDRRATVATLREAFRTMAPRVGPNDVFLFFFSGHGTQTDEGTSDEPDGRRESILLHDGTLEDVEMARIYDTLNGRINMIVLDSCFSGGFAGNVVSRPKRMGLFSSEEDLTSAVPNKFQAGGYLSEFFRRGILGASDFDRNDRIAAGELTEYLRRMYAQEVSGVEAVTSDELQSYQHLVVYRGGIKVNEEILSIASVSPSLKYPVAVSGVRGALEEEIGADDLEVAAKKSRSFARDVLP